MSLRLISSRNYSTQSYNNGANPNFDPANSIEFLLKCEASNVFTDLSANAYTITNVSSVTSSTATAKFTGTASASFSGSNRLTVADAAPLRPGSGSFTWEFWWYPTNLTSYRTPLAKGYIGAADLVLQTSLNSGNLNAVISGSIVLTATTAVTVNTWNHVALVRNGTALTLYIDGTSAGTATNSTNINGTQSLGIGDAPAGTAYPSVGFIQDLRLSSAAKYTANFTPPNSFS